MENNEKVKRFQSEMYRRIKNAITGYATFTYNDITDVYKLFIKKKGVVFTYTIKDLSLELHSGITAENYSEDVINKYKKVINDKIFFRHNKEVKDVIIN